MNLESLTNEQLKLAKQVSLKDGFISIRRVAGFDLSFSGKRIFCSGVVMDYETLEVIEKKIVRTKEFFPYIPTFLSYREAPAILKTYMRLKKKPDLVLLDGQGICHPRGLGIASHIGVSLNKPAIGVAKSRLCGDFREPRPGRPEKIVFDKRQVGWAFRDKYKPIFISPGHRVSLKSSLDIVLNCTKRHRLPEPLRIAHLYATEAKVKYGNRKNR